MTCQRLDNLFSLCPVAKKNPYQVYSWMLKFYDCVDIQLQEAQDKEMLVVIDAGEVEEYIEQMMVLICYLAKLLGALPQTPMGELPVPPSWVGTHPLYCIVSSLLVPP